ncbi:MAG: ABC transporter ATP-binding protein [Bacteroidaceae bacterium]|nr:ABC transporter ATP-binding protein [Bacteroidaceae bacterium]
MCVSLRNISKKYGGVEALRDVSLTVKKGELFGLIGPDGAGKTSIFHILTTLRKADSGEARVCGLDCIGDYREIRTRLGYMPGRFSLYPDLTVEENLNFFASIFGVDKNDHSLIKPIWRQIEPFRKRRAGKLSGGMKQKLALCCALIHKPEVLLLDEPTTGVDAVSRQEFWQMLRSLKGENITILVSTPYMDEAMLCDRIALINEGVIMETDTPQGLIDKYRMPTIEDVFVKLMGNLSDRLQARAFDAVGRDVVIDVKGLTKSFGGFKAVDNISFSVAKGEIFGFLGANGAGKTTAMRILCGLSIPTSGTGIVAGHNVMTDAEQIKKHIGYMSQKFSLYDDLTVWENIELYGGIYGLYGNELKRRGEEMLEKLRFTNAKETIVKSLPLGWKQKLAFSVAMIHRPGIVFLDEPTGGVDPVVRRQFWGMIYEAAQGGTTIFVTTHYMDEAEYCDRISIMVDGRIEALDTPANLIKNYGARNMDEVFRTLARKGVRGGW